MARRAHGEGTIHKRGDGRWAGQLRVAGRRISVYGATKSEVRRKLEEAKRQAAILGAAPQRKTLSFLMDTWLASEEGRLSPSTLAPYHHYAKVIRDQLGHQPLDRITPPAVHMLFNAYNGRPRAALYLYQILHRALALAVRWGWLAANPMARVTRPRYQASARKPWTLAEARRFLAAAGRWRTLWLVALATGFRPGELRGLTWDDIDFEGGTVTTRRSIGRAKGREFVSQGKTKLSQRTIALEPEAMEALRAWKRQQATELLALGIRNAEGWVWTTEAGERLSYRALLAAFRRDAARAGLEGTPYLMRHWHASALLDRNEPVPSVSARLGHATPAITMSVYAHVIRRDRNTPPVLGSLLATDGEAHSTAVE